MRVHLPYRMKQLLQGVAGGGFLLLVGSALLEMSQEDAQYYGTGLDPRGAAGIGGIALLIAGALFMVGGAVYAFLPNRSLEEDAEKDRKEAERAKQERKRESEEPVAPSRGIRRKDLVIESLGLATAAAAAMAFLVGAPLGFAITSEEDLSRSVELVIQVALFIVPAALVGYRVFKRAYRKRKAWVDSHPPVDCPYCAEPLPFGQLTVGCNCCPHCGKEFQAH